jgi:hypothetical protein
MNTASWLATLALVVGVPGAYAVSCWWWPYAACRRCNGDGKLSRRDGKVWRPCPRCKTSGRRLRIGRRLYHYVSGTEKPTWS